MKRQSGNPAKAGQVQGIGKSGNSPLSRLGRVCRDSSGSPLATKGVRGLLSLATRSSLLATLIICVICGFCGSAYAGTWPDFSQGNGGNWTQGYYRSISVTNTTASTLTDYQVKITLTTAALGNPYTHIKADGSDIRFSTNPPPNSGTELAYWIESWNNAGNSTIWVKVSTLTATTGAYIYMYYGNISAVAVSSGTNTFLFFDNFESGNLNTWTKSGSNIPSAQSSVGDPVGSAINGTYSAYVRGTYPGTIGHTENATYDAVAYKDFTAGPNTTRITLNVNSSVGSTSYDHNRVDLYNQTGGGTLIKEWSTPGYGAGGLNTGTSVAYGGVNSYSQDLDSSYNGKTIRFYALAHNGGWQATILVDDIIARQYVASEPTAAVPDAEIMTYPAPTGLTVVQAGGEAVLRWTDVVCVPDETGYKIERKTGAGGVWSQIGQTGTDVVAYADSAVSGNTTYYYRVKSSTGGGDSFPSSEVNITTGPLNTITTSTNWISLITAGQKVAMGQSIAQVKFTMAVSGTNTAHWKRFRVDKWARNGQALIPDDKIVVQVWMETSGDGFFDAGDQMLAQGTFTNNTCYLNMNRWAVTTTPKTYYIIYKFDANCGGGQFAGVNITDSSWLEFEDAVAVGVPP